MAPSPLSPTMRPQKNGWAIAGLVCRSIGFLTDWMFVGLPFSIAGLVLSAIGMRSRNGKELAIAGLVVLIMDILLVLTIVGSGVILNIQ
jgi:hypothetical protein